MGYPIFPSVPNVPGVPALLRGVPQAAAFTADIVENVMSVSSVSGLLVANSALSASGLVSGTKIVQQLTGAAGGLGTYALNVAQTFAGAATALFEPFTPTAAWMSADGFGLPALAPPLPWGIYKDGAPVVEADSCLSMDYRQDWVISDYPVEEGGFESFNKVAEPYASRVRMACGGTDADRAAFLASIEAVAGSLELFDVVTPEKTYLSANIIGYDYRRTSTNGLGLMMVDIKLEEVRETGEADFSQTASPSGVDAKNDGTVQTTTPNKQQQSALSELFGG